jgi:putative uncharacterized protein orf5|nr:MAG TPA: hypothetical protein [Caudoviricetes sp.]DAQ82082.1 MAG TPA: hypothetical protein [Caudoviricetes sp.]
MLENILFIVSQILTVVILPAVKWWLDKGNKQLVGQIESLNNEVKKTQAQVDEVTQIGLQNRSSNKSIMSYRLHREFGEALERGFTTREDFEELSALYDSYKNIGGNGKISALYSRFKNLPIEK